MSRVAKWQLVDGQSPDVDSSASTIVYHLESKLVCSKEARMALNYKSSLRPAGLPLINQWREGLVYDLSGNNVRGQKWVPDEYWLSLWGWKTKILFNADFFLQKKSGQFRLLCHHLDDQHAIVSGPLDYSSCPSDYRSYNRFVWLSMFSVKTLPLVPSLSA